MKERKKVSNIERYWNIIRNGLFLFGLRNRLAQIGIDIDPHYYVQEEFEPCEEPIVKGDASNYILKEISVEELKLVRYRESDEDFNIMIKGMERGQLCIGLENNGEMAAYMFIELNDFEVKGRKFKLKLNEAYLLNMWTFHAYRGKNLAPYLRYQSYQLLKKKGRNIKYSTSDYFNKSTIKFKRKLNSKNLYLYLNIELFGKYSWNFTLKKY